MRWFGRMLASAIARRIAYILVASIALAMCGRAHAITRGEAYAQVREEVFSKCAAYNPPAETRGYKASEQNKQVTGSADCYWSGDYFLGTQSAARTYTEDCPATAPWDQATQTCKSNSCQAGSQDTSSPYTITAGTGLNVRGGFACNGGCYENLTQDASGAWVGIGTGAACSPETQQTDCTALGPAYFWNSQVGVCEPVPGECPEGQKRVGEVCKVNDTCKAGLHVNANGECEKDSDNCPAGQTKAPDGSCVDNSCPTSTWSGSNGTVIINQVKGSDGTCKADTNNDGKADDEEGDDDPNKDGKQFSGGESCDAPPTCSGDAIACGQARIQWRIDCNTRADTKISGGACNAMPVCSGKNCKADEYAQLIMQWRTACAVEKLASGDGEGTGDPNVKKIADAITGSGDVGEDGDPSGAFAQGDGGGGGNGAGGEAGELDQSGFGWGRSCPTIPDVNVMGTNLHFDTSVFCQWVNLGGQLVLVLASLMCLRIISSGPEG